MTGAQVLLTGGDGSNSYAQIGHGGESAGVGLSGASSTETNSGDITVTATTGSVVLTGGSEDDGGDYAQIGHGGLGNADGLSGGATATDSGNITVTANQGSVTLWANGADSAVGFGYAQIGNGGASADDTANNGNIAVSAQTVSLKGRFQRRGIFPDRQWRLPQSGRQQRHDHGVRDRGHYPDRRLRGRISARPYAQIGNSGVDAAGQRQRRTSPLWPRGDLSLIGGSGGADAKNYAQIGNGSIGNLDDDNAAGRQATGAIGLSVGGTTTIDAESAGNDRLARQCGGSRRHRERHPAAHHGRFRCQRRRQWRRRRVHRVRSFGRPGHDRGHRQRSLLSEIDGLAYSSANTLTLLTAGSLEIVGALQNSGSGDIDIVAGWNGTTLDPAHFADNGVYGNHARSVLIGGDGASGNAAVGSAGGTTTVEGANVTLEADNGYAQLGFHGGGAGAIAVRASDTVTLTGGSGSAQYAQIGNGGFNTNGSFGGGYHGRDGRRYHAERRLRRLRLRSDRQRRRASVWRRERCDFDHDHGAGDIALNSTVVNEEAADYSIAEIGNLGAYGSSESGNIAIDTHGGALALTSTGTATIAHVGNWTRGATTAQFSATSRSMLASLSLAASGGVNFAEIGTGTFHVSADAGAIGGNIVINAATLSMNAVGSADGDSQTRIGNLGDGVVTGDIDITTTGDIAVMASGAPSGGAIAVSSIGDASAPTDSDENPLQGEATGNIDIQSGGSISILAQDVGQARIEAGGSTDGTISVTANGDITLSATGTPRSGLWIRIRLYRHFPERQWRRRHHRRVPRPARSNSTPARTGALPGSAIG